jgi:hypothetical protein
MASNLVVIDTSYRRATIKTTPTRHLSDVLEEACKKLNLRSEQYGLKYVKTLTLGSAWTDEATDTTIRTSTSLSCSDTPTYLQAPTST